MNKIELVLKGYSLFTAEILYHLPDHPSLLQSYLWQDYDLAPRFPVLHRFLDYWEQNLEGRLHSVSVANVPLLRVPTWRMAEACLTLH